MQVRLATQDEFQEIQAFYWQIIDLMKNYEYEIKWKKGVYPSDEMIQTSIRRRELYVLELDKEIAGAMILNHEGNESYEQCHWSVSADEDHILVIHALGIHPVYQGMGYGRVLVDEAIRIAKEQKQAALRLDVLEGNTPAEDLYRNAGFIYQCALPMYYEDTGWTRFLLYELPLT